MGNECGCGAFANVRVGNLFLVVAQAASFGVVSNDAVVVVTEVSADRNAIRARTATGDFTGKLVEYEGKCGRSALHRLVLAAETTTLPEEEDVLNEVPEADDVEIEDEVE